MTRHVSTDLDEADPLVCHEPSGLQHDRGDIVTRHTKRVEGGPGVGLVRDGQLAVKVDLLASLGGKDDSLRAGTTRWAGTHNRIVAQEETSRQTENITTRAKDSSRTFCQPQISPIG